VEVWSGAVGHGRNLGLCLIWRDHSQRALARKGLTRA
jgi:hypothetical protein